MGRPPIVIRVIISSAQDSRLTKPKPFSSIPAVSEATGISVRAVRNAYHSGRTSIRKASGEVYALKWMEPVAPIDTSKCYHCHRDLTVKDRSTWFHISLRKPKVFALQILQRYLTKEGRVQKFFHCLYG